MNKVMCVRRRHKKWARFTASECRHKDCLAAAVARRIQGPVSPDITTMAQALKDMYDKYTVDNRALENTLIGKIYEQKAFYYGYWQTAPVLLPETAQEETPIPDEAPMEGSGKPDRG